MDRRCAHGRPMGVLHLGRRARARGRRPRRRPGGTGGRQDRREANLPCHWPRPLHVLGLLPSGGDLARNANQHPGHLWHPGGPLPNDTIVVSARRAHYRSLPRVHGHVRPRRQLASERVPHDCPRWVRGTARAVVVPSCLRPAPELGQAGQPVVVLDCTGNGLGRVCLRHRNLRAVLLHGLSDGLSHFFDQNPRGSRARGMQPGRTRPPR
mmetsp:Transcript_8672/g.27673  ORF Transcript_8672/g.27673 Transcript_8672/m.27673 type:complete len:210 (+) Transcript_8672:2700-3329(+)